ncbi:MAG: RNA polymerase sigma factor [Chitinophagaceae bacterium]
MRRIARGDETAFRQLMEQYRPRIYGSILALTQKTETAEELTQDVFLKVWQHREQLLSIENIGAYLYVSGRNQVISAMRKRILELAGEVPENTMENAPMPHEQLELKELGRWMENEIEKLPPIRKKVFKMSRGEGMSYDEIAASLQISRNTVRDHIVAALNFMRQRVADRLPFFLFFLAGVRFF